MPHAARYRIVRSLQRLYVCSLNLCESCGGLSSLARTSSFLEFRWLIFSYSALPGVIGLPLFGEGICLRNNIITEYWPQHTHYKTSSSRGKNRTIVDTTDQLSYCYPTQFLPKLVGSNREKKNSVVALYYATQLARLYSTDLRRPGDRTPYGVATTLPPICCCCEADVAKGTPSSHLCPTP